MFYFSCTGACTKSLRGRNPKGVFVAESFLEYEHKTKLDKTKLEKTNYTNLTILITEVIGHPFMHIVPNDPGLMINANVDKNEFNNVIATEMSVQLP